MSLVGLIILLIIAAIAGSVGMALTGYSRGGCLFAVIMGFIGAYVGTWLQRTFGLPAFYVLNVDGQPFPIVWAVIGAAIVSLILGLLFRPRRYRY